MQIAVEETLLGNMPVAALFDHAVELGIEGVALRGADLEARVPEIAQELVRTGVRVAAVHFGRQGGLLSPDEAEREQALDRLRSNIACAVDLNAAGVVVVPHYGALQMPNLSPWLSSGELHAEMLHMHLRTLSDFAHALGTKVFIQTASRAETAFITRLEQAGAVVKRIKHLDVKIAVDLGCLTAELSDAAELLNQYGRHLAYASISMGSLEADKIIPALRETGYEGWLTLTGETASDDSVLRAGLARLRGNLRLNVS